ncbi:MAG: HAMP domain-containing methyl-accepting chemotaxis protein, partial [Alphaproteobacteria bacterium]
CALPISLNDLAVLRNAQSRSLLAGTADVDELGAERMLLFADINENFEYLVDLSVEEGFDFLLSAEETAEGIFETQLIAIVALIGIGLLIAGLLGRNTVRPLSAITAVTTRLSKGDKEIEIPALGRRDEIGAMAGALEVFRDKMLEIDRMNAEREALRDETEKRVKSGMISLTQELDVQVQSTVRFVSGKSNEMRGAAEAMNMAISRVSEQADSAKQSANCASENVQSVAAAADQLAHSIGEIANGVSHSGEISKRAVREAEETSATVKQLSEAATKIGDIVSVITDIATQTNLLALNATIEAARAGTAGKGFAVVASEVKGLANQTTSATEEVDVKLTIFRMKSIIP